MRPRMVTLVVVLGIAGAVLALTQPWTRTEAPAGVTLTDVSGIAELQAQVNHDQGRPRLILLLSPT